MKVLSWNCRGLGNPSAVRALKKLLKTHCPDFAFLMETRLKKNDPKAKCSLTCGPLSNVLIIDCNMSHGHRSGGLALIWNDSIQIDFLQYNNTLIDMYMTSCNMNISWYASGIYGSPYTTQKYLTCKTIRDLAVNRQNVK